VYVRQAALDTVVVIGEAFVIQPEQMQDGRVKIVDLERILGGGLANLI